MSSISRDMSAIKSMSKTLDRLVQKLPEIRHDVGVKLANAGWDEANAVLQDHIWSGETIDSLTAEIGRNRVNKASSSDSFKVYMESPAALFVEFGAGVTYAETHPRAAELGMGPGTFPNQAHAMDPDGWWFKTDDPRLGIAEASDGEYWAHSYGNPPYMPMYHAAKAIIREAPGITAEVVRDKIK